MYKRQVYTHQGEMDWWQPVNIYIENTHKAPSYTDFADIRPEKCRMIDFDRQLNEMCIRDRA